jgi:hypothetical protein
MHTLLICSILSILSGCISEVEGEAEGSTQSPSESSTDQSSLHSPDWKYAIEVIDEAGEKLPNQKIEFFLRMHLPKGKVQPLETIPDVISYEYWVSIEIQLQGNPDTRVAMKGDGGGSFQAVIQKGKPSKIKEGTKWRLVISSRTEILNSEDLQVLVTSAVSTDKTGKAGGYLRDLDFSLRDEREIPADISWREDEKKNPIASHKLLIFLRQRETKPKVPAVSASGPSLDSLLIEDSLNFTILQKDNLISTDSKPVHWALVELIAGENPDQGVVVATKPTDREGKVEFPALSQIPDWVRVIKGGRIQAVASLEKPPEKLWLACHLPIRVVDQANEPLSNALVWGKIRHKSILVDIPAQETDSAGVADLIVSFPEDMHMVDLKLFSGKDGYVGMRKDFSSPISPPLTIQLSKQKLTIPSTPVEIVFASYDSTLTTVVWAEANDIAFSAKKQMDRRIVIDGGTSDAQTKIYAARNHFIGQTTEFDTESEVAFAPPQFEYRQVHPVAIRIIDADNERGVENATVKLLLKGDTVSSESILLAELVTDESSRIYFMRPRIFDGLYAEVTMDGFLIKKQILSIEQLEKASIDKPHVIRLSRDHVGTIASFVFSISDRKSSTPIPLATVEVLNIDNRSLVQGFTDQEGKFSTPLGYDRAKIVHSIRITHSDYLMQKQPINVVFARQNTFDLALEPRKDSSSKSLATEELLIILSRSALMERRNFPEIQKAAIQILQEAQEEVIWKKLGFFAFGNRDPQVVLQLDTSSVDLLETQKKIMRLSPYGSVRNSDILMNAIDVLDGLGPAIPRRVLLITHSEVGTLPNESELRVKIEESQIDLNVIEIGLGTYEEDSSILRQLCNDVGGRYRFYVKDQVQDIIMTGFHKP